jgi:hypothetical protein
MAKPPTSKEDQDRAHLVRTLEAIAKIDNPNEHDKRFRVSLFGCIESQLSTFSESAITRMHQAICEIKFGGEDVAEFRLSLQKAIGRRFNLSAYKPTSKPKA